MQQQETILNLKELLSHNSLFHAILQQEIQKMKWGQITINIMLKDGIALVETINVVRSKRKNMALDKT